MGLVQIHEAVQNLLSQTGHCNASPSSTIVQYEEILDTLVLDAGHYSPQITSSDFNTQILEEGIGVVNIKDQILLGLLSSQTPYLPILDVFHLFTQGARLNGLPNTPHYFVGERYGLAIFLDIGNGGSDMQRCIGGKNLDSQRKSKHSWWFQKKVSARMRQRWKR